MRRFIILIVVTFSMYTIQAQADDKSYNQKSIQAHGAAIFYAIVGVNLETYLWERTNSISGISLGAGYFSDGGFEIPLHIYTLWNKESVHHIEFDYGVNLLVDPGSRFFPLPTLSLGYRYQDLSKNGFLFRGGLNLGISPYISVGYAF
ncbi:MAG: hypothetical protein WD052_10935 [Bacteroidales bacterium]